MKIKFCLTAILLFLCSMQIVFAQKESQRKKFSIVSCGVCNSKVISLPKPEYPKAAKFVNASGAVQVEILIDESGNVESAEAISGHPLLKAASVKAAFQAKFEPLLLSGKPIKIRSVIVYNFVPKEQFQSKQVEEDSQETFEAAIPLEVLNDKAIKLPQPKYPKAILQPRSQGDVNVKVKINLQEGKVVSAAAVSGNPLFRKYAVEAAMLAEFQPLKIEGSPLYATGIIVYKNLPESIQETKTKKRLPIIVVGVVNKKATYLPKPIYPKGCRCLGKIKVQIVVDVNGKVISAQTDLGNPLLRASSIQAARQTKFSPTYINGPPIFVVGFLEYNFSADSKVEN